MDTQPITLDQLARLYEARNAANSSIAAAMRAKDPALLAAAKAESKRLNYAYDDARKVYKKQQKAEHREQLRMTMIRFYLDAAQ